MTPSERLITEAWRSLQEADFQVLQALSDTQDNGPEFDPAESITKAISLLTISAQKLSQTKDLL